MAEFLGAHEPMSDAEIETIFACEAELFHFTATTVGPTSEYLEQRRHFIGPVADINHPEFGRENLPSENYMISYRIQEVPHVHESIDEDGTKAYEHRFVHKVDEYIVDHNYNLINQVVR